MRAAGKNRDSWNIRRFLDDRNMNMADVQRAIGAKQHSLVRETITGLRNHRKTLAYLMELGCPEKWLDLPEDMRSQRAA